jgi:hypothetical protein
VSETDLRFVIFLRDFLLSLFISFLRLLLDLTFHAPNTAAGGVRIVDRLGQRSLVSKGIFQHAVKGVLRR